jgi:hypothetical protein
MAWMVIGFDLTDTFALTRHCDDPCENHCSRKSIPCIP